MERKTIQEKRKYALEYYYRNKERDLEKRRERSRRVYSSLDKNSEEYASYCKRTLDAVRKWRKENPEKNLAHRKVFVALRNGSLKRHPCFCGKRKTQAHHTDYSKPLNVVWLCKKHHVEADLILRIKNNKQI